MQKGFAPIIIILGIVLILGITGGAFYFNRNSSTIVPIDNVTIPTPTIMVDETANPDSIGANWKTYTNKKYGFTLQYPSDLKIHEYDTTSQDSESEFWLILDKNLESAKNIDTFLDYVWKDRPRINKGLYIIVIPKEWKQRDLNKPSYTCEECTVRFKNQQTTFLGIKANKSIAEFPDDPLVNKEMQPYTYLIFNFQGKGWSIAYDHLDFKGNYDSIYDQILSTFKFLPTSSVSGESGIKGKVVLGPTCPVAEQGKDQCQAKPLQATVLVKTSDGIKELSRFTSDIQGNFEVTLSPGKYLLEPVLTDNLPYGRPQAITVEKGKFTQTTISYDTGLR